MLFVLQVVDLVVALVVMVFIIASIALEISTRVTEWAIRRQREAEILEQAKRPIEPVDPWALGGTDPF